MGSVRSVMFREKIEWKNEKKEEKKYKRSEEEEMRERETKLILKKKQKIKWPIKGYVSRGSQNSLQDIRKKSYWLKKKLLSERYGYGPELCNFYLHENEEVTQPFQAVHLTCKFQIIFILKTLGSLLRSNETVHRKCLGPSRSVQIIISSKRYHVSKTHFILIDSNC